MVTTFEKHTSELTPFEKHKLLPILIMTWRGKDVGQKNSVTMGQMIQGMNNYCKRNSILYKNKIAKVNGPRMRKLIHEIRVKGYIPGLIANSKGYFVSNDKQEIEKFHQSLLERSNSFLEVANAVRKHNNL